MKTARLYLLLTLLLTTLPAVAELSGSVDEQPMLYQVELIIFQHSTASATQQLWPKQVRMPKLDNAIELSSAQTNAIDTVPTYQLLPPPYFKLKTEARQLQQHHGYKTLLHIAWLQPLAEQQDSKTIHIYGGQAFDQNGNPISADNNDTDLVYWQINGAITLSMDKFITIKTHLVLTDPKQTLPKGFANSDSPLKSFPLHQVRRMKINELNYFDNPMFGMLIKVFPAAQQ